MMMMMKKAPGLSMRNVLCLGWKLVIFVSLALCVLAFVRIQHYSQATRTPFSISLPMRPRVLADQFAGKPKLAFLFLVRKNLPLDFLWDTFFENVDKELFSVYIHSEPGFVFDESTTRSPIFYNRQLKNSIKIALALLNMELLQPGGQLFEQLLGVALDKVIWGEASMIEAERLLFEEALQDPGNQEFSLLSDSCVPLYNFSYVYDYVMGSPRSFVDSFFDRKDERYTPLMSPVILRNKWRKGSQWVTLMRRHAQVVVDDQIVFHVFRKFCKRRPPVLGKKNLNLQKQHNCIPDEHYVQTLLSMNGLEGELERRTLTYTSWNQSTGIMDGGTWHPFTFSYADSGPQHIQRIKDIDHVNYDTEFRTEWCSKNSALVPCFIFARKFSQGAAMHLLSQGLVGNLDTSVILESPP